MSLGYGCKIPHSLTEIRQTEVRWQSRTRVVIRESASYIGEIMVGGWIGLGLRLDELPVGVRSQLWTRKADEQNALTEVRLQHG